MKVFLDVGAHEGWTLHAVRDPKYRFDRIYCFEPAPACWPALAAVPDGRVEICRYGLWNETTTHELYDAGSRGASIYADKFHDARPGVAAAFVRATDWFLKHLGNDDEIFMKLNCEGAEVDIVEDLLDSGQLTRVRSLMVDPDVRKIPSQAHRERELYDRLRAAGLTNYFFERDVMVGDTHRERIQNWLRVAGAEESAPLAQSAFVVAEAFRGRREPLRRALRL
jgi:FkbM family methyltransferase